jgi:GT2 family glycosyltransferase
MGSDGMIQSSDNGSTPVEPLVCTITLNWNTKMDTAECMGSILKLNYGNIHHFIVDNGSEDGSIPYLEERFGDRTTIIRNEENLGYAKGFNVGIEAAMRKNPKYLLIHNSDIIIDREAVRELVNTAETDDAIGFVTGKVYFYDRPEILQTVGKIDRTAFASGSLSPNIGTHERDTGQYDTVKDFDFIEDFFMLVRSEVIRRAGPYDPDFFLMAEIEDWCVRVRRNGFRIVFTPEAKIWHKGSISSGGRGYNPMIKYYLTKNRILFMRKNYSGKVLERFMFRTFTIEFLKEILPYIILLKFAVVAAILRGKASGLKWFVSH